MTFPRLATPLGVSFRDGELGVITESEGALFRAASDFWFQAGRALIILSVTKMKEWRSGISLANME